jgi:uncharacterized protein (DUF697 family)
LDTQRTNGDNITVGDISNTQGIAIGRNASAHVVGHNLPGDVKVDAGELRTLLEQLYDALGQSALPREQTRLTQTAAGNALAGVTQNEVHAKTVVEHVQKIGETLKQANVAVQEGSSLWENVKKLAPLLGPLVGGARVVAGWFGIPL